MRKKIYLAICVIIASMSCQDTSFHKTMENFMGTEISVPDQWRSIGPDSIPLTDIRATLIVWIDSLECNSCKMNQLYEWNQDPVLLHAEALKDQFRLLFIFSPKKKDIHSLRALLKFNALSFPIILDEDAIFAKINPEIPSDNRLHAFLLNKDDQVVLIGNPIGNDQLWSLYKDQIRELINEK